MPVRTTFGPRASATRATLDLELPAHTVILRAALATVTHKTLGVNVSCASRDDYRCRHGLGVDRLFALDCIRYLRGLDDGKAYFGIEG